jgi:hypothetical protein
MRTRNFGLGIGHAPGRFSIAISEPVRARKRRVAAFQAAQISNCTQVAGAATAFSMSAAIAVFIDCPGAPGLREPGTVKTVQPTRDIVQIPLDSQKWHVREVHSRLTLGAAAVHSFR